MFYAIELAINVQRFPSNQSAFDISANSALTTDY